MSDIMMEERIFFEPHIPTALRQALCFSGENGFVLSMPQLLQPE